MFHLLLINIINFIKTNELYFPVRRDHSGHWHYPTVQMHRAMCRRFDTIPACDGQPDRQTDGIAVANTALAMRALRAV